MQNLFDLYTSLRESFADNLYLREEKMTYAEVIGLAFRRAQFLKEKGYKKGDIIAILSHNSADWIVTYLANTALGIMTLLLDTNLTHSLYQKYLDLVETKAVFVSDKFSHHYQGVETFDIDLKHCLADSELTSCTATAQDISTMLYTSGTSGDPKVVGLTHSNIISTCRSNGKHVSLTPNDVFLSILPFYHVYGLLVALAPLSSGGGLVIQPSVKGTDILKSLSTHPVTIFPAVPQVWELFIERILMKVRSESKLKYNIFMFMLERAPTFHHVGLGFIPKKIFSPVHKAMGGKILRYILTGGARMKRKYWLYYKHMGFNLLEGYGLTETSASICGSRVKDPKPICVGQPMEGNEVQIRNDEKGLGEIWVRGTSVMPGYYKNDAVNQEVFDKDGWFNTGDVGFIDKDGDLHIRGRKKNVIVLDSGKNAYPEEIESFYLSHTQSIEEIAVFGHRINGKETIYAVITPLNKESNAYTGIREELRRIDQGLPTYKRIGEFAISYEPLPRTSTKKVIIREVIKNLEANHYQLSADDSNTELLIKNKPATANV